MRKTRRIAATFDAINSALVDILLAAGELREEFDPRWPKLRPARRPQPRRKRTRTKN